MIVRTLWDYRGLHFRERDEIFDSSQVSRTRPPVFLPRHAEDTYAIDFGFGEVRAAEVLRVVPTRQVSEERASMSGYFGSRGLNSPGVSNPYL